MIEIHIRPATADDAQAVSELILRTLRESNAKDYSPEVIARVQTSFGPTAVRKLFAERQAFVAVDGGRIIGTASLEGRAVRTMFVSPDAQRQGVGTRLMAVVASAAEAAGVEVLVVPASVTAESFYARLGFAAVRDAFDGEERTIVMERRLTE